MSTTASAPLMENEHVRELLDILKEHGKDATVLTAIIGSVSAMERQLNAAAKVQDTMLHELSTMREEWDHPVKTLLEKASRSLSAKIGGLRARLKAIKDGIINGCKKAVEAFKDKGISALNNLAGFFEIKQHLLAERDGINACIEQAHASVAKIEAAAAQYHTAGLALRNIGRAVRGKEAIPEIKPNGKLARLIAAPYSSEIRRLNNSLRSVNKSLASLDRLEKAAAKSAEAERPSTRENMKRLQRQLDAGRDVPTPTRAKRKEAEI